VTGVQTCALPICVIREDVIRNLELSLKSKNGKGISGIFSSSALKDELNNTAGVACTVQDITESNRRKEELRKAKEEIEEKNIKLTKLNEMKSEFISMVSHEIRTPLAIMKQFVSIMLDRIPGKINDAQAEYLGIINNNISRLVLIVNDLLDISKLEAGKMKLSFKPTDMPDLINDVMLSFKNRVEAKNITLSFSPPVQMPLLSIDPNRITQVLTNLIDNAVKFTPPGGKITLEAARNANLVLVSVTDTGQGIPPGNLTRIFEMFEQLDMSQGRGSGLGLSISKKIVELHGGSIWAESPVTPERTGSRFVFTLKVEI
jgi:signal transduction histidine kinase